MHVCLPEDRSVAVGGQVAVGRAGTQVWRVRVTVSRVWQSDPRSWSLRRVAVVLATQLPWALTAWVYTLGGPDTVLTVGTKMESVSLKRSQTISWWPSAEICRLSLLWLGNFVIILILVPLLPFFTDCTCNSELLLT